MPAHRLPPALNKEAWEAWERHGGRSVVGAKKAAAEELGLDVSTIYHRANNHLKVIDPAIKTSMAAIGTNMIPTLAWVKTKEKDGVSHSVLLKPIEVIEEPEDILERIADRLNCIKPAPFIKRPKTADSELRNFIPIFDIHMSMRVGDYGTAACVQRLIEGSRDVLERLPRAECTIIVQGGDASHQNDGSNLTPASKHPLPVDAEYDDTTDILIDVFADIIEDALTKSVHVLVKMLRGNHDPNTARIMRAALRERYRKNNRVTIDADGTEFFAHEWGANLILAQHGDIRINVKDLVLRFAAKYSEEWGRTKYRDLWVGHLHHLLVQEFPGMTTNQVRAISPADRHAERKVFGAHSEMIGVTYHRAGGRWGGVNHCF